LARFPALLNGPGGCGTRPCGAQTVLADSPRPVSAARRRRRGQLQNRVGSEAQAHQAERGFDLPALCGAEQRRAGRKKGEHCL